VFKSADVLECFQEASVRYGAPASYLTDNAAVFTAAYRGKGWVALERALIEGGTTPRHSRLPPAPGPLHTRAPAPARCLRRLLQQRPPPPGRPPALAYAARPKAAPSDRRLDLSHDRIRRDVVDNAGKVTLRYGSKLLHIGIGRRYEGTPVMLLIHERDVRVLKEDGQFIRSLTLDPSRNYQPQA
jgi:hypothetical protein